MEEAFQTPAYVVDLDRLESNLRILADLKRQADCHIVLALKAYSLWHTFPLIAQYLDGCCASGIHEARLSHEHFGKRTLAYSPAYTQPELEELLKFAAHIDFNSASQWARFREQCLHHPRFLDGKLKLGLRVNPEHSTCSTEKYDPCSPYSRLGATMESLREIDLTGISGLHFHTLCEQYTEDLENTLEALDQQFGDLLKRPEITWLNIGGGHWITKHDYDKAALIKLIKQVKQRYQINDIWIEPGEAVAIHSGTLESTVLDIMHNGSHTTAIMDVSPTAHMPDTLEMPYRPEIIDPTTGQRAGEPDSKTHTYWIAGPTCLAGDTLGQFSFQRPLSIGDRLSFDDMAHYTMVKSTTFNGVTHPSIVLKKGNTYTTVREFSYEDFKNRLG